TLLLAHRRLSRDAIAALPRVVAADAGRSRRHDRPQRQPPTDPSSLIVGLIHGTILSPRPPSTLPFSDRRLLRLDVVPLGGVLCFCGRCDLAGLADVADLADLAGLGALGGWFRRGGLGRRSLRAFVRRRGRLAARHRARLAGRLARDGGRPAPAEQFRSKVI